MGGALVLFLHNNILQQLTNFIFMSLNNMPLQRDIKMKLSAVLTHGWSLDLLWRNAHYRIHVLILSGLFKQHSAPSLPHFVSLSELVYHYKYSRFSYYIMTKSAVCYWFYSQFLHATLLQKEYRFLMGFKKNHRSKVWIYFKILFLIFKYLKVK